MKKNVILFDLDGTLIDTSRDVLAAFNALMDKHNLPHRSWEDIVPLIAKGSSAMIELGLQDQSKPMCAEDLQKELIALRHTYLVDHSQPFAGIAELLDFLDEHHITWGIVSNNYHDIIDKILKHFGWENRCQCVVGCDDVPHMKPAADPLLKATKLLQTSVEACVYVGDFRTDIQAANHAGMDSIIAAYGYVDPEDDLNWGANAIAHQVSDLRRYIENQCAIGID